MIQVFDSRTAAIAFLGDAIKADLARATKTETGQAALLLSGGSTPVPLYESLAETLDFDEIIVGLVDERWVPETDAGSNAAMIKRSLLKNLSVERRDAKLIPMYLDGDDLADDAAAMDTAYQDVFSESAPVIVLGMGADGHTASWFPTAPNLDQITAADYPDWVVAVDATGSAANATAQRVTLSGSAMDACDTAYLFITGDEKRVVFENTAAALPIHTMAALLGDRLRVIWAA